MTSLAFDKLINEDDLDNGYAFDDENDFADEDNESTTTIRGRYIMDGAETIAEAIEMLQSYAGILQDLADSGYELVEAVEDDYALLKIVA